MYSTTFICEHCKRQTTLTYTEQDIIANNLQDRTPAQIQAQIDEWAYLCADCSHNQLEGEAIDALYHEAMVLSPDI